MEQTILKKIVFENFKEIKNIIKTEKQMISYLAVDEIITNLKFDNRKELKYLKPTKQANGEYYYYFRVPYSSFLNPSFNLSIGNIKKVDITSKVVLREIVLKIKENWDLYKENNPII
jgi:hypothetical protein